MAATVDAVQAEVIKVARPISDQSWGLVTAITLPGGVEFGLYSPATGPQAAEVSTPPSGDNAPGWA